MLGLLRDWKDHFCVAQGAPLMGKARALEHLLDVQGKINIELSRQVESLRAELAALKAKGAEHG